jgi:hypothetical protein
MAEPVKREPEESEKPKKPKKPYTKPTLTVYGTVTELTQKVGLHGDLDGGIVPPHIKTQF